MGWEKEYTNGNKNCIVRIWDKDTQRMIAKEDCGGPLTEIDGHKGQASNGFKRACALGWGLGNTEVLVYGLMLVFTIIFGAQMIGFGTLANMILIGYVVDLCRWIWRNIGFATFIADSSTPIRILIFAITLICFVIVAAIYINAQMGVAPYDAMPQIISEWIPKVPFFVIRILFDLAAVLIGVIAGKLNPEGIQGSAIGSIIMSLMLGPVISLVGKPLKRIL
jgi:uncharacterized membrane protein YczE